MHLLTSCKTFYHNIELLPGMSTLVDNIFIVTNPLIEKVESVQTQTTKT